MAAFEIWASPDGQVRFCFSHTGSDFTTGVMILAPGAESPKHNRPLACESLLQIEGSCKMTLLSETGEQQSVHELDPGALLTMKKGQWHIHANSNDKLSVTLFKAEGDITAVVDNLRHTFTLIQPEEA